MGNSAGVVNSPVVKPPKPHQTFVGVIELVDKDIRRLDNASKSEQDIQEYIQGSQRDTMTPDESSKIEDDRNITTSVNNTIEKVCSALDKIKQRLERLQSSVDNFGDVVLHQCEKMKSDMNDEILEKVSDRLTATANAVGTARERLEPVRETANDSFKGKHAISSKPRNEVDSSERPATSFTEADRDRYEKEMKQMKDIIDNLEDELESLKQECNETETSLDTANERMQKIEEKILEERLTHEVEVSALRAIVEKQEGMIKSLSGNTVNEEWLENQKNMMFSFEENDEKMSNDTCFDLIYVDQKSIADDNGRKLARASKYETFTKSKENINYDSSSLASTRLAIEERNTSKNEILRNADSTAEANEDLETPSRVILSFPKQAEDQDVVKTRVKETQNDTERVSKETEMAMQTSKNNIRELSQNKQINDRENNDSYEGIAATTVTQIEDNINSVDTAVPGTILEKGYEKPNIAHQQGHDSQNGMEQNNQQDRDSNNEMKQNNQDRGSQNVMEQNVNPTSVVTTSQTSPSKHVPVEVTPGDTYIIKPEDANAIQQNETPRTISNSETATSGSNRKGSFHTTVLNHNTENIVETATPVKVSAANDSNTNNSFDTPVLIHKTENIVETATPVNVAVANDSNTNDSFATPVLIHKTENIVETETPVKIAAENCPEKNESFGTPVVIHKTDNIEERVGKETTSLREMEKKEEVLLYEEGITKEIIYKRNDGEVDGCLSYYKGLGAIIRTSVEDFGVDTVQCDVTDAVQNEMLPDLVEGERAISFYIHIHKKYGTRVLMKDGDYVTIYVPHRIIPEHEEATLVCSINGDDWEQCDLEDDVPVSLGQGVYALGTTLKDVSDVKLVAIAREKTVQLIVGEDDVMYQSLVDPSVSVKINTECFPARCGVSLIVRHNQQRTLASAVDIHRECQGIVSCTAFVSLVCERVTTDEIYVMMELPPGNDYECKFTIFVQNDSGWKLADCDWNKTSQVLTIHLTAGAKKYRVIGLELPYEMSVEERLVAVHALQIHSTKHYTVRVMFRQKDSDPSQAVVICMRADLIEQGIAQLKEAGYTIGGAPSEQFCLIDGDVLALECSGDITAQPYNAKRMEVPFHSQKEIASRQITLHPVSPDTRSGAKLYQATLHVMKKAQQNYVVLVETIHMPTEKS